MRSTAASNAEVVETDVCVVGAGFAGLTAAWRLKEAGRDVLAVEARDRIGGRSWTERLPDGAHVDRGCGWVGAGHERAYALAAEMGVETYPTWGQGEHIVVRDGEPRRYRGTIPRPIGLLQLASLGVAFGRLERMARRVPRDAPWDAPRAARWDGRTLADWLERALPGGAAQDMLGTTLSDIFTSDLTEVSLLGGLHLLSSNHGLERLVNIENGHQESRVVGGTQAILDRVHERLGGAVRLSSPVSGIRHGDGGVEVTSPSGSVRARRAIVAVPIWLTDRISWDPPLPRDRAELARRAPTGAAWKFHFIYETPWWRDQALSGQSLDTSSHIPVTLDACGPDPPPGILFALAGGNHARELSAMSPDARRDLLVGELVTRFGPEAGRLEGYVEQDWTAEEWICGAMTSHFAPGTLTSLGHALRPPVGPIHWAGTEVATEFMGTIEGAIESGERAAREVMA